MSNAKYAKHNKVRFKSSEEREKGIKMFNEFFEIIEKEEEHEMKCHIILESMSDHQEAIVLTFLEIKNLLSEKKSSAPPISHYASMS